VPGGWPCLRVAQILSVRWWIIRRVHTSGGSSAARSLGSAVANAVAAAQQRDAEDFDAAAAQLDGSQAGHADTVLSAVVRMLLEDAHPGGLDGEAVRDALTRCVRGAIGWFPGLDVSALIVVLSGALGVLDAPGSHDWSSGNPARDDTMQSDVVPIEDDIEPEPVADPALLRRHALIVIADLAAESGARIGPLLSAALSEIERAETLELP
jgi:hypothetical protein